MMTDKRTPVEHLERRADMRAEIARLRAEIERKDALIRQMRLGPQYLPTPAQSAAAGRKARSTALFNEK